MTLLVRDEQDIIRENIEFHRSQGVDYFIATDNKSEDRTPCYLKDYEKQGILHYIYEGNDNYNQHEWVTRMARMTCVEHSADWVINNDADEFWWPLPPKVAHRGSDTVIVQQGNHSVKGIAHPITVDGLIVPVYCSNSGLQKAPSDGLSTPLL